MNRKSISQFHIEHSTALIHILLNSNHYNTHQQFGRDNTASHKTDTT